MSYFLCSLCGTHLREQDSDCPSCTRPARGTRSRLITAALGITFAAGAAACDPIPEPIGPSPLYGGPPLVDEDPETQPTNPAGEGSGETPISPPLGDDEAAPTKPAEGGSEDGPLDGNGMAEPSDGSGDAAAVPHRPTATIYGAPPATRE